MSITHQVAMLAWKVSLSNFGFKIQQMLKVLSPYWKMNLATQRGNQSGSATSAMKRMMDLSKHVGSARLKMSAHNH